MLLEKAKKILRPIYGLAVYRWRQSHPRLEIELSAICWIPIAGARAVVEGRQSSILSAQ
jgi:DNA mismatch repair protein MutH